MRKSLQPVGPQAPDRGLTAPASLQPLAAGAAITLYAAWNARNLLAAWLHSPFDRCGSVAFLLWIVPILLWAARPSPRRVSIPAFAVALLISFAGVAADLGALKYLGLALALAAFLPLRPATSLWLPCAAAWMPAAGWAFSAHGPLFVNSARVAVGLAALATTPLLLRDEKLR